MLEIASWNVNSIRARLEQVTTWLKARQPDVLLLQELKGAEFPSDVFKKLGYDSAAVTQKAYNGVAILSRYPMKTVTTALLGDEADSHSRFLEVMIEGLRVVNIYLPNGNPVGSDNFAYKLAWMDRLHQQLKSWKKKDVWWAATSTSSRKISIVTSLPPGSVTRSSSRSRVRSIVLFSTSVMLTPSDRCIRI